MQSCSIRTGARPSVRATSHGSQRRPVSRVQAVGPRAQDMQQATSAQAGAADSWARVVSTAALTALVAATTFLPGGPALADADLALGKQTFNNNCAACHQGGKNSVVPARTLSKEDIASPDGLGQFTLEAIVYQVENGKNAMPAWSGTLDDDEIQAVAAYVFDTAGKAAW